MGASCANGARPAEILPLSEIQAQADAGNQDLPILIIDLLQIDGDSASVWIGTDDCDSSSIRTEDREAVLRQRTSAVQKARNEVALRKMDGRSCLLSVARSVIRSAWRPGGRSATPAGPG